MEFDLDRRFPGLRGFFDRSVKAASIVMRRRMRVLMLVQAAYRRMSQKEQSAMSQLRGDLTSLLRLTHAWSTRRYHQAPWKSVLLAVAAILYFLNPIDLIPDALLGIGFLDDAAVIGMVVKAIHNELRRFERWDSAQKQADHASPDLTFADGEASGRASAA